MRRNIVNDPVEEKVILVSQSSIFLNPTETLDNGLTLLRTLHDLVGELESFDAISPRDLSASFRIAEELITIGCSPS